MSMTRRERDDLFMRMQKPPTLFDVLIERIRTVYPREEASREGISYWPDPLPTPECRLAPDPLVLFESSNRDRVALVPLSLQEVVARRNRDIQKPSMQIPLGLVDKPEFQQREIFLIDLHGSALSGGPLLITGVQNSGKGTALQTILLWLTARYLPSQFRCAVIDPNRDLEAFQNLPYLHNDEGHSLWTDGSSDEQIIQVANRCASLFINRREAYPGQRWNDDTLAQLWAHNVEVPLVLLIVSHYHRFIERMHALYALKKLVLLIAESRALGAYTILTSAETSARHLSPDLMSKIGTKIGLFLNEQQRIDLFGRPYAMDPIPGRGLILAREHHLNYVQLALASPGVSETERAETLQHSVESLTETTYLP